MIEVKKVISELKTWRDYEMKNAKRNSEYCLIQFGMLKFLTFLGLNKKTFKLCKFFRESFSMDFQIQIPKTNQKIKKC